MHLNTPADTRLKGLSLFISAATSPAYNLPIYLYGLYAHERADSSESLRTVYST